MSDSALIYINKSNSTNEQPRRCRNRLILKNLPNKGTRAFKVATCRPIKYFYT